LRINGHIGVELDDAGLYCFQFKSDRLALAIEDLDLVLCRWLCDDGEKLFPLPHQLVAQVVERDIPRVGDGDGDGEYLAYAQFGGGGGDADLGVKAQG